MQIKIPKKSSIIGERAITVLDYMVSSLGDISPNEYILKMRLDTSDFLISNSTCMVRYQFTF